MAEKLEESVLLVYNFIQAANSNIDVSSGGKTDFNATINFRRQQVELYVQEHALPNGYKIVLDKRKGHYYMTRKGKRFTLTRKQEGLGESRD